jgi:hypothetical protein
MKKLKLAVLVLAAGLIATTSCKKDETHAVPTVSHSGNDAYELDFTTDSSQHVVFNVYVKAEAEVETFSITETKTPGASSTYDASTTGKFKGETDKTYSFDKVFTAADFTDVDTYTYEFRVTDKDGQVATTKVTVKMKAIPDKEINSFTAVLMGAQSNTNEGSFYDAETNTVYTKSDADNNQESVDFVYYYGSSNEATIAAPNDSTVNGTADNSLTLTENWTTQNNTLFYKTTLTKDDFDAITNANNFEEKYNNNLTESKVTKLENKDDNGNVRLNTVVAFKTVNGKIGLFCVTAVDAGSDGTITIDVKIAK